jgi:hypothetical protein
MCATLKPYIPLNLLDFNKLSRRQGTNTYWLIQYLIGNTTGTSGFSQNCHCISLEIIGYIALGIFFR